MLYFMYAYGGGYSLIMCTIVHALSQYLTVALLLALHSNRVYYSCSCLVC